MRSIAPPRDTASVFFHRSPCWSSPSSRPEHDLENLQAFDETMRPRRYLERNRDCVRTDFAPGRPPPVHPRLTGACAAMRSFQICVSGHAQMQRPPSAWTAPVPASRCQTARRVVCPRSPSRSRGALSAPGLVRPSRLVSAISTASPLHLPALRRARAQILGVSCSSDPEMRGPAERREAHYLLSRS